MNNRTIFISLLLILISTSVHSQVSLKNNFLRIENEQMIQILSFDNNQVVPTSVFSKELNEELINKNSIAPWFEFVINKTLLKSSDPIWQYRSHQIRKLNNGGEEVKILIEAIKLVKGLQLEIYRQYFPGSTLIREKLMLKATNQTFAMNKKEGRLHFIFPRYALKSYETSTESEEIRIASFADEILKSYDPNLTYDDRKFDNARDINLANCHMFHPKIKMFRLLVGDTALIKGPFGIYHNADFVWMSTYEHASQDKNFGTEHAQAKAKSQSPGIANDQQQGVEGKSGLVASDNDFWFLGLESIKTTESLVISLNQLRGGYLDGEKIDAGHPYETVWSSSSFLRNDTDIKPAIHQYLWSQITENTESRKSHYYYNTWGMQRDVNNKTGLREIFTENRILEEIRNAAELKVDLFVLDDGWEQTMGDWQPHKTRLPNGFAPLIAEMKKNNIIPGAWLSPMGIDSLSERFIQHPEWVIRDETGAPIKAQWGFPAFDFVSGFYNLFVNDCKALVDQGIRFFKWDAINTFDSTLPDLNHGSSTFSKQEIRDRYAFLLPFYVTRAMKELREYNPDVVVEIDLTEKERCIIGLMPLQEGKFFWMNNGASGYNDYSTYRTKSMRTVISQYAGIIPSELFTQAVYPQNEYPFFAQHYNVNSTLVGGHGFWGNLKMMKPEQRLRVGSLVVKSKKVLPYIVNLPIEISGLIGSSPEVYTHVNREKGAGQVIAFSASACNAPVSVNLKTKNCLGVLNHAYSMDPDMIHLPFQFNRPDDTREAFILSNRNTGIGIVSSTGWIDDVQLDIEKKTLKIVPGNKGIFIIRIPSEYRNVSWKGVVLNSLKESSEGGFQYFKIQTINIESVKIEWK
ncbi:MAG TPA: alpha-galactosidase [Prolixibacteraceae bacterium]|nr:alpha-galactosidase [Prolixibacteraceae bacterium]